MLLVITEKKAVEKDRLVAEEKAERGGEGNGSEDDNEAANQGAGPVLDSSVSVLEAQARAYNITAGVPAPTLAPVEEGREVRDVRFVQSHSWRPFSKSVLRAQEDDDPLQI